MNSSTRLCLPVLAVLSLLLAPPARASGGGGGGGGDSEIIQFLASTGADANGTCRVRLRDKGDSTDFNVELDHMSAGDFELWVSGVQVHDGTLSVGSLGEAEIEYETPKDGAKPLFDFAVLDQLIEIRQGLTVFFSDTFDGTGSGGGGGGGGDTTKTEIFMVNVGPDLNAQGRLKYEAKGSKLKFSVEVEHLDAGTYDLLVAGAPVSQLTVTGVEQELEFQDPVEAGKSLLDFDPLGAQVDIASGATIYLTAVMPGSDSVTGSKAPKSGKKSADDLGKKNGDKLLVLLASSGVIPGASGKATLAQSGETEFEVEFEDAPAGDYALQVGGVEVATLTTLTDSGQWSFSTSPSAGQALLDFEVQGQLVAILHGTDTVLSVVFPVSVQSALGTFKKEIHDSQHVKINLVATGVDLDARGQADFKDKSSHDTLVVSVFDLAPGEYDLVVDGAPHAGVLVVSKQDGKAKVTFDSQPKGNKLLLDFTVPGATVQVTPAGDAATVLLAGVVE